MGGDAIRLDQDHAARSNSWRALSRQGALRAPPREDVSPFAIDILACPHCEGRLRLIATLHDPAVIRKLLAQLGIAP